MSRCVRAAICQLSLTSAIARCGAPETRVTFARRMTSGSPDSPDKGRGAGGQQTVQQTSTATVAVVMVALCVLLALSVGIFFGPGRAGAQGDLEPPTITSSDAATFTVDQQGSFTVTTTPGNDQNGDGLVSLSESGALPDGVTFVDNGDGTATLAGMPGDGTGATYPITITASQRSAARRHTELHATVEAPPTITSSDAATFTVDQQGPSPSRRLRATTRTVTAWCRSRNRARCPIGVTFVDNGDGTATLAGMPATGPVHYPITITASNGAPPDATQSFTLTVEAPPTITSSDLRPSPSTARLLHRHDRLRATPTVTAWCRSGIGRAARWGYLRRQR